MQNCGGAAAGAVLRDARVKREVRMAKSSVFADFALAAFLLGAAWPAFAATTVIDAAYTETHQRLGCNCAPVTWTRRVHITLSGRNSVHEQWTQTSSRNQSRSVEHDRELGKSAGRATWRVAGPNRLERTLNYPQHLTIMVITTRGDRCDLKVEYRLKPGFSDILGKSALTHEWTHFSLPQVTQESCQIR